MDYDYSERNQIQDLARADLSKYKDCLANISLYEQYISELETKAQGLSSRENVPDMVQESHLGNTRENKLINLINSKNQLDLKIKTAQTEASQIIFKIEQLEDHNQRYILTRYYIFEKTLQEISDELFYSYSWTKYLHNQGLINYGTNLIKD